MPLQNGNRLPIHLDVFVSLLPFLLSNKDLWASGVQAVDHFKA